MHQILKRRPGNTSDHGDVRNPKSNRYPLEVRAQAWRMLVAGEGYKAITAALGIGKTALHKISKEGDPMRAKVPPRRNHTKCSGEPSCDCVLCAARAEAARRLAEMRAELKAREAM